MVTQKPSGTLKPARSSTPRFTALPPARDLSRQSVRDWRRVRLWAVFEGGRRRRRSRDASRDIGVDGVVEWLGMSEW